MSLHDDRMRQLDRRELDAFRSSDQEIAATRKKLRRKVDTINAERERLAGREDEPEVLVRTGPGPAVEIFHDAGNYCGRVSPSAVARGRYERVLLFEALDDGLRPCTACAGHLWSRRRPSGRRPGNRVA